MTLLVRALMAIVFVGLALALAAVAVWLVVASFTRPTSLSPPIRGAGTVPEAVDDRTPSSPPILGSGSPAFSLGWRIIAAPFLLLWLISGMGTIGAKTDVLGGLLDSKALEHIWMTLFGICLLIGAFRAGLLGWSMLLAFITLLVGLAIFA